MSAYGDNFRVWFQDEPAARTRLFNSPRDAQNWAAANRPHKPYNLVRKPMSLFRRLRARFGLLRTDVKMDQAEGVQGELDLRTWERDRTNQQQPGRDRAPAQRR